MELKWLGHASWKIKTDSIVLYIDPYEGEYDEKADLILITHIHSDHCSPEKIKNAVDNNTIIVAPKNCKEILDKEIKSLEPGMNFHLNDLIVEAVQAYNYKRFRKVNEPYHPKGLGVGYILRSESRSIYHVGDTDFIEEMRCLKGIDVMLVASGGTYTMDNQDAADAVIEVNPKVAIPMHVWDTNPQEFKKKVETDSDTEVVILKSGESYTI